MIAEAASLPSASGAGPADDRLPRPMTGTAGQMWHLSHRASARAARLADRHYNRQKPGTAQFVPPGRCLVLLTVDTTALWVTSYPFPEYVQHQWAGALVNSLFRREPECPHLASELITAAIAATAAVWTPPPLGMVTFIDTEHIRRKRDPGRCYLRAGFEVAGHTKGGLLALRLPPDRFPAPQAAVGSQPSLLDDLG